MTRRPFFMLCAVGLVAAGCTLGPDYRRPDVEVPAAYREAEAEAPTPGAKTLGDLEWWTIFQDPELQELIRTTLAANYDLRVAVSRILQAQSQLTITRSQQFPTVNAQVDAPYSGLVGGSERPATVPRDSFTPEGGLSFAWELDLWGKFRRATESARAQLLASEEVRNGVVTSLIAQVAQAYFNLRAFDLDLEISRRTVDSREQSVELVRARLEGGVAGILDLQQAQTLLYTATKSIPDTERQIAETENLISILQGKYPGPIPRGRPLGRQLAPPTGPIGLPSALLARRPDVRQAEQQLVAANAQIGVATTQFYPQVLLSGFGGVNGFVISGQSFGPFGFLSALPVVSLPLFNAGRVQAGVNLAEAQTQEAAIRYQQTIQQAVREVSDALVDVRKLQEVRVEQEKLTRTLGDASQVARQRYEGGVSSYLEVLDTERQFFQAELDLTTAQLNEMSAIVQLYKALGGGWQADLVSVNP
ncbi:MAG TPA: efflux transporter outer membrane subunit [Candidatus Methylomirabilis sp.]|nr:efflux transporter outer membrane subunit [Candidatus Methylomirabilis sp.]